jgi:hypothetical protein
MEESLEQSKDISTLNADLNVAQNSQAETPAAQMSMKVKGSAANVQKDPVEEDEDIKDEIDEDNYDDDGFEEENRGTNGIEDFYGTNWDKKQTTDAKQTTMRNDSADEDLDMDLSQTHLDDFLKSQH